MIMQKYLICLLGSQVFQNIIGCLTSDNIIISIAEIYIKYAVKPLPILSFADMLYAKKDCSKHYCFIFLPLCHS